MTADAVNSMPKSKRITIKKRVSVGCQFNEMKSYVICETSGSQTMADEKILSVNVRQTCSGRQHVNVDYFLDIV